jgi:pyrroloquinoline quinone biosynthesis protein B
VRLGRIQASPRTQSSIIVSDGSADWVLINASPDLLTQIKSTPALQPARQIRDSGIAAVVLMDAQVDHVAGLLMLRERNSALPVYATQPVFDDLSSGLPLIKTLEHYCKVERHLINLDGGGFTIEPLRHLEFKPIPLSSKAPPYSPHRHDPHPGDNIGLLMTDHVSGKRAFYAPGLGVIEPQVHHVMQHADVLLVDGTFWTDDEMIKLGLSTKRAIDMGHLAQSGPNGMLQALEPYSNKRRILIHINNTNPILRNDSPQAQQLKTLGIEVAYDGMHIEV